MQYDQKYKLQALCTKEREGSRFDLNQIEFDRDKRTLIATNGKALVRLTLQESEVDPLDRSGMIPVEVFQAVKPLKRETDVMILAFEDDFRLLHHRGAGGILTFPRRGDAKRDPQFPPCDVFFESAKVAKGEGSVKISLDVKQLTLLASALGAEKVTLQFTPRRPMAIVTDAIPPWQSSHDEEDPPDPPAIGLLSLCKTAGEEWEDDNEGDSEEGKEESNA